MESNKSTLIESVLEKMRTNCDSVNLIDLSNLMQQLNYIKLKKITSDFFSNENVILSNVNELIDAFKGQISENGNNFLKRHISENDSNKDDNISLSSDDLESDDESEPSIKCRRRSNQKYVIETDSDIEIIDDVVTGQDTTPNGNRKRRMSHSKENIDIHRQSRYEFRDRKGYTSKLSEPHLSNRFGGFKSRPTPGVPNVPPTTAATAAEVIQIEDSSDEDDVQEIKRENNGNKNNNNNRYNKHHNYNSKYNNNNNNQSSTTNQNSTNKNAPTQSDPSQLASIPLIVQFPTMQSATFNGHLYISHNHKFSVKLQGVDPTNFRFN